LLAHGAESFLEKNLAEGLGGVRTPLRVRCRLVVVTLPSMWTNVYLRGATESFVAGQLPC
jgi:hypothetical protein